MTVIYTDTFEHSFDCTVETEFPSNVETWYFPENTKAGGKDGLLVKVVNREARRWIGVFAFGDLSPKGITGVYSCPDAGRLLVVAKGQGYYVSADHPQQCEAVRATPVLAVFTIRDANLIVIHDYTRFVAYGRDGIAWTTPSLSWDGLESIRINKTVLTGIGWNAPMGEKTHFEIALTDGSYKGGSSPDLQST